MNDAEVKYDVVVIGGAFSGASFGTLLRRWRPESRVLVVEGSDRFERRVGEATVEVSGCFLHRILRLHDHLARQHLPKHGLRYWFTDATDRALHEMTEVGPRAEPDVPSYQLDRSKLDQHLLETAGAAGCEVLRPARVVGVDHAWPESRVRIESDDGEREVRARWVVDASGRHAFIARRQRLHSRVERHPTAAAWARWTGVVDLDGVEVLGGDARESRLPSVVPARRLATNHFCGYGWWCWMIPLSGGETSVGLVYNKELFELPGQGSMRDRYRDFVTSQAGMRELLAPAAMETDDFMSYGHLPYRASRYMDRGWALVGDAAAFIDPYYSPGLDHASISIYATARMIEQDLAGGLESDALQGAIDRHNASFSRSYDRWLDALYDGKYELFGDADLTRCAFLLDTALYYSGVVTPVYEDPAAFANPLFGLDNIGSNLAYRVIRTYNQRLLKLARMRRHAGTYGRGNVGHRSLSTAFTLGRGAVGPFLWRGLKIWARLEAEAMVHRIRHGRIDASKPVSRVAEKPVTTPS